MDFSRLTVVKYCSAAFLWSVLCVALLVSRVELVVILLEEELDETQDGMSTARLASNWPANYVLQLIRRKYPLHTILLEIPFSV